MHFITFTTPLLLLSRALASAIIERNGNDYNDLDDKFNIFKNANSRFQGAICKNEITTNKFPTLVVPPNFRGGCVRYYQGIDMTGVVTEVDIYFPKVQTACDCIAACLTASASCTNWVWKHTFNALDGGRRSCTLYSSPNLPSGVTLDYNLTLSIGFQLLQPGNNPQAGGGAPIAVLKNGNQDPFAVSGFLTQDVNGKLYC